ncbi:MAG: DUF2157 domain-containing protein [Nocardioidaceae bacterium]|nr:DUF2157 domain-containing protein [Nocardioidaceae bacterium]
MTTPAPADHAPTAPSRAVSSRELSWLRGELPHWTADGLISEDQSARILQRYHASRGFSLATLVLTLGSLFVGVGLIWLVAANLDQLSPLARFLVVAAFWVVATVTGEWLAARHRQSGGIPSPVVGAVQLLAAASFGAVVFQAAQSLQVPAYEPKLVGIWALGALIHAYASRAMLPLLVGLATGTFWFVWQTTWDAGSLLGVVLAFVAAGIVGIGLAVLHERWMPAFAAAWREVGVVLLLVGLFAGAIPGIDSELDWTVSLAIGLGAAALVAVLGLVLGVGRVRLEPLGAVLIGAVAVVLALWETGGEPDVVTAGDWLHAGVAVVAYVLVSTGVAALGVVRDSWRLTALATIALVVFTTFQSFAVFARIIEGAWLFVILGVVFLATGFLADRARRRLAIELEGEAS